MFVKVFWLILSLLQILEFSWEVEGKKQAVKPWKNKSLTQSLDLEKILNIQEWQNY